MTGYFPELDDILGQVKITQDQLMRAGKKFVCALYGVLFQMSMGKARHRLFISKKGKTLRVMALPPTEPNLMLHLLRVQHAMILAKSVVKDAPPVLDITSCGYDVKDSCVNPVISKLPARTDSIIDSIACSCAAVG